jgi:hypothetical protein
VRTFSSILLVSFSAAAAANAADAVAVRIFDRAGVAKVVMEQAARTAQTIFREADIELHWLICPKECTGRNVGLTDLYVRIEGGRKPKWLSPYALGFAATTGDRLAVIRYPRLVQESLAELTELGPILGATIAHELGHLVMGSTQHSQIGVMKARWNREDMTGAAMGRLVFLPWEAEAMHENLTRSTQTVTGP